MRTHASALLLCALSLAPIVAAHAADAPVVYKPCDKKPTADDTDAARGLFQAGRVSYNEADYAKAIQLWRDAFERDCTATPLLQNLANAYEKQGNIDGAIVTLETFLKRDPQNSEAPTIQKRIENMRKARAAPTAPPTQSASATAPPATTSAPPPPPPATTAPAAGSRPLTPLFVAGGGGVVAIVGGLIYLSGTSKYNDANDRFKAAGSVLSNAEGKKAKDDGDSAIKQQNTGSVIAGVGAVVGVGGLVWYFLSKPEPNTAKFLRPEVAPGYAGFSYGKSF